MTMNSNSSTQIDHFEFRKQKNKEEMNQQIIVFSLTLFLTIMAFAAIAFTDIITVWFAVPFIVILAVLQAIYQLFYFMHMNHKGHEAPIIFIFSGILVAIVTVVALMTIVWI
ncbi:cytochrome c oxidase subunit IVB [Calidifontibacillus oryziterrae]|uniref:cytochrome c oxidase subunit IVB n=1 Tax=Calidifontibacillus oryziterrae TaxID=1191699 RepID=UPI0003108D63|nr:cytochrome c oxidase subunit IVB [Calidifontibacillus oryziterrae]